MADPFPLFCPVSDFDEVILAIARMRPANVIRLGEVDGIAEWREECRRSPDVETARWAARDIAAAAWAGGLADGWKPTARHRSMVTNVGVILARMWQSGAPWTDEEVQHSFMDPTEHDWPTSHVWNRAVATSVMLATTLEGNLRRDIRCAIAGVEKSMQKFINRQERLTASGFSVAFDDPWEASICITRRTGSFASTRRRAIRRVLAQYGMRDVGRIACTWANAVAHRDGA